MILNIYTIMIYIIIIIIHTIIKSSSIIISINNNFISTSAYESRIAGRPWKLKWEPKIDPNEYIEINQAWVDSNEYPYYLSKNAKLVEDISFSWEDQFFIFFEEGLTFDGCGNKIIINRNNYRSPIIAYNHQK